MDGAVFITGQSGVGKTSIIDRITNEMSDCTAFHIGTLIANMAVNKGLIKEADDMKMLDEATIMRLRLAAFEIISKTPGITIVDTHISIIRGNRVVTGMPDRGIARLKLRGIIYIDADAGDIIKRRVADFEGRRAKQAEYEIDAQRQIDMSILGRYITSSELPVYIIKNRQGHIGESTESVKEAILSIFGLRKPRL